MNTKMKTAMRSLLLLAGLSAALPVVRAEEGAGQAGQNQRQERQERRGGPGERLEMLRERLGLTDAQVAQLKEIFAAEREEMAAKRKELGKDADRAAVREAMQPIREKYRAKIADVLTPEQREKFARMQEKMQERGGPGGQGGPGGAGGGEGKKRRGPGGEGDRETMPPPAPESGV